MTACVPTPVGAQQSALDQGVLAYSQKDYQRALAYFLRARNSQVTDPGVYYYVALCRMQLGDQEAAVSDFRYIIAQFPRSAAAQHSRTALSGIGVRRVRISGPEPASSSAEPPVSRVNNIIRNSGRSVLDTSGTLIAPDRCRVYYELHNNSFYIEGQVNGKSLDFVFDTGASTTFLGKNQLEKMGMSLPQGKPAGYSQGVGGSGLVPFWKHKINLKVGPIERRDYEVSVGAYCDVPLLGQTFFNDFQYTIDKADSSIVLVKKSASGSQGVAVDDRYSVPFTVEHNEILVEVQINGKPYKCYFDTGATMTCFSYRDLAKLNIRIPDDASAGIARGIGGSTATLTFPVSSMKLGPIEKYNFNISVVSTALPKPLLGQTFFGDYKYTIDNDKKLIKFVRR